MSWVEESTDWQRSGDPVLWAGYALKRPPGGTVLPPMIWLWTVGLVLDFAHSVSPIALVCSHRGLREIAVRRWQRCIALPAALFFLTSLVAAATVLGLTSYDLNAPHQFRRITGIANPLPLVLWANWAWNIYHFSQQNFGLARVLRLPGTRWFHRAIFAGGTATVMLVGLPQPFGYLIGTLAISFGHWITEIWLTWRVSGYRVLFILGVLIAGCAAFAWDIPTPQKLVFHASGIFLFLYVTFRIGFGFAHFLTDAWIWKMSDSRVRAAIGVPLTIF